METLLTVKEVTGTDFVAFSKLKGLDLLPKKKIIRNKLHIAKDLLSKQQITEIKKNFVDITPYIRRTLALENNEKYYFLQILVEFSTEEHTSFKGSNRADCTYDRVMKLAREFNTVYGKSRQLDGCYDCGTMSRAIFMAWKHYKEKCIADRCPIKKMPINKENEIIDYEYNYPQFINGKKLTQKETLALCMSRIKDRNINKDGNIFILSVALPDGIGHIWTIEAIPEKSGELTYRIYQSSLNEYLLIDYMSAMDYDGDNNLYFNKSTSDFRGNYMIKFMNSLSDLCERNVWNKDTEDKYLSIFHHIPALEYGQEFYCNFMFTSLYR